MIANLLYFLIVVVAIYFVTTMINVVHVSTLPPTQQAELAARSKFRSDYLNNFLRVEESNPPKENFASINNPSGTLADQSDRRAFAQSDGFTFEQNVHIKNTDLYSSAQIDSRDYKIDYFDLDGKQPMDLPTANDLFILIRSEYIDTTYANDKYKFNLMNLPTRPHVPNATTSRTDKKYIDLVRRDILLWNNLFPRYYHTNRQLIKIKEIKPTFINETDAEFVLKADIKLGYQSRSMHFRVEYYGQRNKALDFLNGETDTYVLKLLSIRPMTKTEFDADPDPSNLDPTAPFVTMQAQMIYVDKVNKLHQGKF